MSEGTRVHIAHGMCISATQLVGLVLFVAGLTGSAILMSAAIGCHRGGHVNDQTFHGTADEKIVITAYDHWCDRVVLPTFAWSVVILFVSIYMLVRSGLCHPRMLSDLYGDAHASTSVTCHSPLLTTDAKITHRVTQRRGLDDESDTVPESPLSGVASLVRSQAVDTQPSPPSDTLSSVAPQSSRQEMSASPLRSLDAEDKLYSSQRTRPSQWRKGKFNRRGRRVGPLSPLREREEEDEDVGEGGTGDRSLYRVADSVFFQQDEV